MDDASTPTPFATRRQVLVGVAGAVGQFALNPAGVLAATEEAISRTAEAIHHVTIFKASRKRVYEALTETAQFYQVSEMSAAVRSGMVLGSRPTEIAKEVGGPFSIFSGHIVGRHIELAPHERIVQAWRVVDWDPGVFSVARFMLREQGQHTRLVFDHTGFPEGQAQHLAEGWKGNYWEPLEKFLA